MSDSMAAMFQKHRNNITRFDSRFQEIFGLGRLKTYYADNALEIAAFGFDIFKFADDLSAKHCDDPNWCNVDSPFSLMEMILLFYKREGLELIETLGEFTHEVKKCT